MKPQSSRRRAFSLIEMAVVLGLVSLVIGAIWLGRDAVQRNHRTTQTVMAVQKIVAGAHALFPIQNYPSVASSEISGTIAAHKSGIIPADFSYISSSGLAVSPYGAYFSVRLACYASCPSLIITLWGPAFANAINTPLEAADCLQVVRRIASFYQGASRDDLRYISIAIPSNSSYAIYYPPIDPSSISCPANWNNINFVFNPSP